MSELKEALINISEEVRTKIIPENIKAGVQIFDVVGNYTVSDNTTIVPVIPRGANNYSQIYKCIQTISGPVELASTDGASIFYNCTALTHAPKIVTKKATTYAYAFYNCSNLYDISEVQDYDLSKVRTVLGMFYNCVKITEIPEMDFSNIITMDNFVTNCSALITVPVLNLSNIQNAGMLTPFSGCTSLSDESLNNIMASCITAVKITSTSYKTLKSIGLSADQATICQGLSNYQAFLDAGWTTGY